MYRILSSLTLAATVALAPISASAETIGIATLQVGAINNLQAQIIAKVVQRHAGLQARVLPMGGTSATLAAVNAKAAEFSTGDVSNMRQAIEGGHGFSRPLPNLRVVLTYNLLLIGFLVRNDSDIKTIADLKGKKFPTGWPEFPNALPLANALFATAGYSIGDMSPVPATGLIPAANDFKVGRSDATLFAIVAPKVRELNAAISGGIRVLSIEKTPASLAAMKKIRQDYKIITVRPGPPFPGVRGPTNVLGTPSVVTAGAHVSDETVYKVVKAMAENKAELVKGHPSFRPFDPKKRMAATYPGLQHHPGAIKFFKEKGIWSGN